jgi:hypothetical protein
MMVVGLRDAASDSLPFKVSRVVMMAMAILWAKGH